VPELPEVEAARRQIAPAMVRARITAVDLRRPDLRKPFPPHFARRLTGQTVVRLTRRAKYLLAKLSSGETLVMHLGMSGSLRVERDGRTVRATRRRQAAGGPHDHVVFHMSSGNAVVFNDPATLSRLGPEPLSEHFDAEALARACRGRKTSLKAALMDQRVVAGLGNIYASEALHVAGLSPRRRASTIATATGMPKDAARRLTAAIKQVLEQAILRQSSAAYRNSPFLVYDRQGEACPRKKCRGTIRHQIQGGRATYYCPVCQR
jgi:formamidopyrimidine-DNA glycosylase